MEEEEEAVRYFSRYFGPFHYMQVFMHPSRPLTHPPCARDLSPRSRVWSEPSYVEAGAYEFAETAKFLDAGGGRWRGEGEGGRRRGRWGRTAREGG